MLKISIIFNKHVKMSRFTGITLIALLLLLLPLQGAKTRDQTPLEANDDPHAEIITSDDLDQKPNTDIASNIFDDPGSFLLDEKPHSIVDIVNGNFQRLKSHALKEQDQDMKKYLREDLDKKHLAKLELKPKSQPLKLHNGAEAPMDPIKVELNLEEQEKFIEEARQKAEAIAKAGGLPKATFKSGDEEEESNMNSGESSAIEGEEEEDGEDSDLVGLYQNGESSEDLGDRVKAGLGSDVEKKEEKKEVEVQAEDPQILFMRDRSLTLVDKAATPVEIQEKGFKMFNDLKINNSISTLVNAPPKTSKPAQKAPAETPELVAHNHIPLNSPVSITVAITLFVIFIGIVMFLRDYVYQRIEKNFLESLESILKDVITIYLMITVIRILSWFDVFERFNYFVNVKALSIGFMVFSIFWFVLAVYNVIRCIGIVKRWNTLEKQFGNREGIFRAYENLYLEHNKNKDQKAEMEDKRQMLEYFLIRQEFISPTFIPILHECFLRDDFNFSSYLAKCLGKSSVYMFKYSFSSLLTILLLGSTWFFFLGLSLEDQLLILGMIPILSHMLLWIINVQLRRIYKKLVHIVDSPYDINFTRFENVRQPYANLDKLKVPLYLSGKDDDPAGKNEAIIPNRHEKLFFLDNPLLLIRVMHVNLIMQIMWLAIVLMLFVTNDFEIKEGLTLSIGIGVTLFNLLYLMPNFLEMYTMDTNIQMLKDKELILNVIDEDKIYKSQIFMKVFKLFKAIGREQRFSEFKPTDTQNIIMKQVRGYMKGVPNDENGTCKARHLVEIAHFCGHDLNDEEVAYLAKSCVKHGERFGYQDLMESIEKYADDVKQDRFKVIKDVLTSMIDRDDGMVSLRQFREAISSQDILPPDDVQKIMQEIRYLPFKNAEIRIDIIARFIRDMTEGMPH